MGGAAEDGDTGNVLGAGRGTVDGRMEEEEEAALGTGRCSRSVFSQWDNGRKHREPVNRVSPV